MRIMLFKRVIICAGCAFAAGNPNDQKTDVKQKFIKYNLKILYEENCLKFFSKFYISQFTFQFLKSNIEKNLLLHIFLIAKKPTSF